LPPALVTTEENDVLRDEGKAYARKLIGASVPVTATRYLGTIHDFVMLNALADTPAARGAVDQATAYLRTAFARRAQSFVSPRGAQFRARRPPDAWQRLELNGPRQGSGSD
jgi:acetyl esterase/lipase